MPTSELDAINVLLSTIGEAPVSTFSDPLPLDAAMARQKLAEISRAVQLEGWNFNTVNKVQLTPDADGHLNIPSTAIWADINRTEHPDLDFVQVGSRFFDRTNNTDVFDEGYYCDFVYERTWTELPELARRYIMIRAARVFQLQRLGSESLAQFNQADENQARSAMEDGHSFSGNYNVFDTGLPPGFYQYRTR